MNHHQIEKNGMYKKLSVFFSNPQNNAIWKTFKRLVNEITRFVMLNQTLANYMMQQSTDSTGLTKTKDSAMVEMVKLIVNKARKAYVWALDTKNVALIQTFDVEKSDFLDITETEALVKLKQIRDALNANISKMSDVQLSPGDITAIDAAIKAYENTIGSAGAALSSKKTGTEGIDDVIREIDQSLDIIDRLIDSTYSESHPDMIKEYWNNRAIDRQPTRHSGISVHITNAKTGHDLEGATLQLNGKSDTSDIHGIAEIIKMKPGTYNATVTFNGSTETIKKVVIERGKISKLEVKI